MASHPGGKNFSIIFAYITSSAFKETLLKKNIHGKLGKEIFGNNEWINPREFLRSMKWIQEDGEESQYSVNMLTDLFNSFVQDKALRVRDAGETFEYSYIKDLKFPDNDQVALARESNGLFMMTVDDLTGYIQQTFENGYPAVSRDAKHLLPLWEALHNDRLVEAFRQEHVRNIKNNLPKNNSSLNFLEIGVFTGLGTVETIDAMVDAYHDMTINYTVIEDIEPMLNRAKQKIEYHISSLNEVTMKKNIKFKMNYINQVYSEDIVLEKNNFDMISVFQVFHYIKDQYRETFVRDVHNMLKKDGVLCMGQSTSHSLEFPYPFTLIFCTAENFMGYPIKAELKLINEPYFSSIKVTGLDAIWTLKKPINK